MDCFYTGSRHQNSVRQCCCRKMAILQLAIVLSMLQPCRAEDKVHPAIQNCIDLSDMRSRLPLTVIETSQVFRKTEAWENNTFQPGKSGDSLGYPSVVLNDHGPSPDGQYYLFYAHHDPTSGIGCAVAKTITGPYVKLADLDSDRQHSMVLVNPHYPGKQGDPSHFSSPCVVWNEDEQLWFMYFHYYNHYHGAWKADPDAPGFGDQMTAMATCSDLQQNEWQILEDKKIEEISVHSIVPVLPTTDATWMQSQSSYHSVSRLANGEWLAFLRGTPDTGLPTIGFARSANGRTWDYFEQNPVLHQRLFKRGNKGIFRPGFIGFLGKNRKQEDEYLVVWTESPARGDVPQPVYGYTTDFVRIRRDRRGYGRWQAGDGQLSARREGNRLYIFTDKYVHTFKLSVSN
jgi:hypothetical protein